MIILLFSTTARDDAVRDEYERMEARMRELAAATPGFVSWRDYTAPDGEAIGVVEFESEDALAAWRDHPDHAAVHKRGRDAVYASYRVRICRLVRESSFDWSGAAGT